MSGYATLLFVHVTGALGFFAALALEWASLAHLRSAGSAGEACPWLRLASVASRVAALSMVALVVSGGVMTVSSWEREAWLTAAMVALVPLAGLALAVSRPRMCRIRSAAAEAAPPQDCLQQLVRDRLLWVSLYVRLGLAAGIVFLMTVKPGSGLAVPAIVAGAVLGLAAALRARGPRRPRPAAPASLADAQTSR